MCPCVCVCVPFLHVVLCGGIIRVHKCSLCSFHTSCIETVRVQLCVCECVPSALPHQWHAAVYVRMWVMWVRSCRSADVSSHLLSSSSSSRYRNSVFWCYRNTFISFLVFYIFPQEHNNKLSDGKFSHFQTLALFWHVLEILKSCVTVKLRVACPTKTCQCWLDDVILVIKLLFGYSTILCNKQKQKAQLSGGFVYLLISFKFGTLLWTYQWENQELCLGKGLSTNLVHLHEQPVT